MSLRVIVNIFAKNPPSIAFAIAAILYILAVIYAASPIPDKDPTLPNTLMNYAWNTFIGGCLLQALYIGYKVYQETQR